jgi:glutathione S-transferase
MSALEETGLDYTDTLIDVMAAQQKSADYLAINPKGKVPALRIGDRVLTENPAIISYLHHRVPLARLLPPSDDPIVQASQLSDLVWAADTLHPTVRQILAPHHYTDGDATGLRIKGLELISAAAAPISARIGVEGWWYGADWSIMDVYLFWVFSGAVAGGLKLSHYPVLAEHTARVRARASFQRALKREAAALESAGVELPPGVSL